MIVFFSVSCLLQVLFYIYSPDAYKDHPAAFICLFIWYTGMILGIKVKRDANNIMASVGVYIYMIIIAYGSFAKEQNSWQEMYYMLSHSYVVVWWISGAVVGWLAGRLLMVIVYDINEAIKINKQQG